MVKSQKQPPAVSQQLLEQYQLTLGEPCPTCLCELYRTNMYQWSQPVCVRCYPPRGYHAWSNQLDALYPRKRAL